MTSLYNNIFQLMVNNNNITNAELIKIFPSLKKKTIQNYASEIRRKLKDYDGKIQKQFQNISINTLEPLVLDLLNKAPNQQNLKLALDLLKAKIADKGMDDNLDIDKYILKAKSCQEGVDESIDVVVPIDDDLIHQDSVKEIDTNISNVVESFDEVMDEYYDMLEEQ